jgi:hypothetical protein
VNTIHKLALALAIGALGALAVVAPALAGWKTP